MKVYLNEISGLWQAVVSMYMSKRTWTREMEEDILSLYEYCYDRNGFRYKNRPEDIYASALEFKNMLDKLFKWAPKHITMTRFIDFSFTVEGLHRGAQDDFDAHAKRLENRILRSSTRLAKFGGDEKSDWYKGKILTTDEALKHMEIAVPHELMVDGKNYVKTANGYVLEEYENNKDVLRGLYMLSIPSNFTCRVNCTEFAHILKERDKNGRAHPELQKCVEEMLRLIQNEIPQLTREWFYSVRN